MTTLVAAPVIDWRTQLIACPYCRAHVDQTCRTSGGNPTSPHACRLTPRLCPCGELLEPRKTLCETCRAARRRLTYAQRERRKPTAVRRKERVSDIWFKVDDQLALHPKTLSAGNTAMGLWVRAGAWSASVLADGNVPPDIVALLGDDEQADRLVSAGLWLPTRSGYKFHDWRGYQPTRKEVELRRQAGAERLRKWRQERRLRAVNDDEM